MVIKVILRQTQKKDCCEQLGTKAPLGSALPSVAMVIKSEEVYLRLVG